MNEYIASISKDEFNNAMKSTYIISLVIAIIVIIMCITHIIIIGQFSIPTLCLFLIGLFVSVCVSIFSYIYERYKFHILLKKISLRIGNDHLEIITTLKDPVTLHQPFINQINFYDIDSISRIDKQKFIKTNIKGLKSTVGSSVRTQNKIINVIKTQNIFVNPNNLYLIKLTQELDLFNYEKSIIPSQFLIVDIPNHSNFQKIFQRWKKNKERK